MTILCIIGRSGTGKTTVEQLINKLSYPGTFHRVVSHTTRPMRQGETDGVEHIFTTADRKPDRKEMIAYTQYGSDPQGNPYEYWADTADLQEGAINTYVIDVEGLRYLAQHFPRYTVYVLYVRRDNLESISYERLERDRNKPKLTVDQVDFTIVNNGTLRDLHIKAQLAITYFQLLEEENAPTQ